MEVVESSFNYHLPVVDCSTLPTCFQVVNELVPSLPWHFWISVILEFVVCKKFNGLLLLSAAMVTLFSNLLLVTPGNAVTSTCRGMQRVMIITPLIVLTN